MQERRVEAEFAELAPEHSGETGEGVGVGAFKGAVGELGFNPLEGLSKAGEILLACGNEFFLEGLPLDSPEGADLRLELAVPVEEGVFGDVEFFGDAREAEAFDAEGDELVFGIVGMHSCYSFWGEQ